MSDFLPEPDRNALGGTTSPSEGILGGVEAAEDWIQHEIDCERAYLGTLMGWNPRCPKVVTVVGREHFGSDLRADILSALRELHPWTDCLGLGSHVSSMLASRYGLKVAALEYAECVSMQEPWGRVEEFAQVVIQGWKRRERVKILSEMSENAHDSEAIAAGCEKLAALD